MKEKLWIGISALATLIIICALGHLALNEIKISTGAEKIERISQAEFTRVSEETKTRVKSFVDTTDMVIGVQLISADFIKNRRKTILLVSSNENITRVWGSYINNPRKPPSPLLWPKNEQNGRLVRIINGQFICDPFETTPVAKIFPESVGTVKWICGRSIPPGYGDFAGFMNILLSRKPTLDEIKKLDDKALDLAAFVYKTDIEKK